MKINNSKYTARNILYNNVKLSALCSSNSVKLRNYIYSEIFFYSHGMIQIRETLFQYVCRILEETE